ncbi:MAG: hypothetical protein ACHREM_29830, partial [Polyangiales bacterium]
MTIAGTFPERGLRVALTFVGVDAVAARYEGSAFTPRAQHSLAIDIDVATGKASVAVTQSRAIEAGDAIEAVEPNDLAFITQLSRQLWKLATQTSYELGGGK